MHLETTAGNLASAMKLAAGIVERRNTIPILGCVRIGKGKIVATNLDQEIEIALPQIGKGKGESCVDYFRLSALIRQVDADETVTLAENDALTEISFNGSAYKLASLPARDFPEFPKLDGERTVTDNMGLAAALARVAFAISTEETRYYYYLNGVAFLNGPDGPAVCATDGHRLAVHPVPLMPDGAAGTIMPKDTVAYMAARKREPKAITFGNLRMRAEYDGMTLSAKLIDGTYPDIWRVIPQGTVQAFTADRARLLNVLNRISCFAIERNRAVKLTGAGGVLTLYVKTPDGEGRETIDCEMNEPFDVCYNCHYLIQALATLSGERVTLASIPGEISGSPATIKSDGDTLLIVLMPMRV